MSDKEQVIKVLGIENEFEGDAPLYFDLTPTPENGATFLNYVNNNLEKDQEYVFKVKDMTVSEYESLEK